MWPELRTGRLLLRLPREEDGPVIERCVSDFDVARMTMSIPHPYPAGGGLEWVRRQRALAAEGKADHCVVTLLSSGELVGAIGLRVEEMHHSASLGYWIGKPFWGRGYCTEAALALRDYAFGELQLNRLHACHWAHNPASGRVMQKLGMRCEGVQRQKYFRFGAYIDAVYYALLASEYAVLGVQSGGA